MRCTDRSLIKKKLLCIICIAAIFITGCEDPEPAINAYNKYSPNTTSGLTEGEFFAKDYCVSSTENIGVEELYYPDISEGAGVFNLSTNEVSFSKNIYDKMYPASTTKILTAIIILKKANLDDLVTISKKAANPGDSSSVCGVMEGDKITVRDLLYGLMLSSGNDAAIALAEYCSGSVEAFSDEMNAYLAERGATRTHFVNPHGLPDEEHYTTIYDMHLIMREAIKIDEFKAIINSKTHKAVYTDSKGEKVERIWRNTCKYINGDREMPKDINVIGGKTGTTGAAGYCLVLYSQNSQKEDIISIVFKASGRSDLYLMMDQILSGFAK